MERSLAAVLIADVAGYGHLSQINEEGTRARLQSDLREVIEPKFVEHHSRLGLRHAEAFLRSSVERDPNCLALGRAPALAVGPAGVGHGGVDGERGTFGPGGGEGVLVKGLPSIVHVAVVTGHLDRPASLAHRVPQRRGGAEEAGGFRITVMLYCQGGQRLE